MIAQPQPALSDSILVRLHTRVNGKLTNHLCRAALQLNEDLNFSPKVYGFGSGAPSSLPLPYA